MGSISLSSDGNIIAIGSPGYAYLGSASNMDQGQCRIYQNIAQEYWLPLGNSINGQKPGRKFGSSVRLSGDGKMVAIASHDSVEIYDFNDNGAWISRDTIAGNIKSMDLSEDGSTLVLGSSQGAGKVLVYNLR